MTGHFKKQVLCMLFNMRDRQHYLQNEADEKEDFEKGNEYYANATSISNVIYLVEMQEVYEEVKCCKCGLVGNSVIPPTCHNTECEIKQPIPLL